MKLLSQLSNLISDLKNTSSTLDKVVLLNKYGNSNEDLKKILFYTHYTLYQYYVTSSNCTKNKSLVGFDYSCIFSLLDDLRLRKITGHDAISAVNGFCKKHPDYKDVIFSIIDKDLKTRTGEKIINKAFPGLIPEFEVALAEKYEPDIVDWKDEWYVSRKLDGVRCIGIVDNHGNTTFYSREGKEFDTLGVVAGSIKNLGITSVVFDGELCLIDEEGNEDFQGIMKQIKKKNHTISNPSYKIFDMLNHDEFYTKKGEKNRLYSIRYNNLREIMKKNICSCLSVLAQERIKDNNHFEEWVKKSKDSGYEGVMLRANQPYKGKRSKDLLKFKEFQDAEYVVIEVEMGPFRYVKEGKEHEETMLSCVTIKHKDHPVRVGSGFSIEQRQYFYQNPQEILGKIIRVNYFEETKNQDGTISLRFPTLAYIYGDSRDT